MADPRPLPGAVFVAEIPPGEIDKLDSLRAWAERPENHWTLALGPGRPPGTCADRRRGVLVLEGRPPQPHRYVVVFTVDESAIGLLRHASVSCDATTREVDPFILVALLNRLGFLGGPDAWTMRRHPSLPNTLQIVQPFTVQ